MKKTRTIKLGPKSSTLLPNRESLMGLGKSRRTLTDYAKSTPLDVASDARQDPLLTQFGPPVKRR